MHTRVRDSLSANAHDVFACRDTFMVPCVAVSCRALQCVAVCCSVLQCVAVC